MGTGFWPAASCWAGWEPAAAPARAACMALMSYMPAEPADGVS